MNYIGNELEFFKDAVNWKDYYSSKLKKHIKGNVLEVGAGIGINSNYLCNKSVVSWTFLEPDSELCREIKKNTSLAVAQEIIVGTIEDVKDDKFDTIIYIDVLEHIEDSEKEIIRLKKKLKDNGKLLILVPAYQFLFNEFDEKLGHFRRYNKRILTQEINGELTKKELYYLDSMGFFASLMNRFFLKESEIKQQQVLFWDKILVRISRIVDVVVFRSFGKSLIGVYEKI